MNDQQFICKMDFELSQMRIDIVKDCCPFRNLVPHLQILIFEYLNDCIHILTKNLWNSYLKALKM